MATGYAVRCGADPAGSSWSLGTIGPGTPRASARKDPRARRGECVMEAGSGRNPMWHLARDGPDRGIPPPPGRRYEGSGFVLPPREVVLSASRETGQLTLTPPPLLPETKYAFVGLRSCDLHAIDVQDRVFMIADPAYRTRRAAPVFIGVTRA